MLQNFVVRLSIIFILNQRWIRLFSIKVTNPVFNCSGPKAGLQLILSVELLNVEQYEDVPNLASDIGVQVS